MFNLLTKYYLFKVKRLPSLISFWEKACVSRSHFKSSGHKIAEMAMSVGSKFDGDFQNDELLKHIHYEFGALEAESFYRHPDNEEKKHNEKVDQYWTDLGKEIQKAKLKYSS